MTRKSKQQCVSTVTKGVLIAQQLTYPLARISKMSPNCPKYRIFRGLLGNITFTDTQWITAGLTHRPQVLRAARCLRFGASGMTLRRASPSLFSCRVALRPRTFAPYPSRSSRTGADRCIGGWRLIRRFFPQKSSVRSLRSWASAVSAALGPGAFAPYPKVAPPTIS